MTDLLFDVPWWIPAFLIVIGVSLFVNGNKRQIDRVRNFGIAMVLLAVAWSLISYFVDTDKEKVQKQTRAMVQEVANGQWPAFGAELTPAATFSTTQSTIVTGGPKLVTYAQTYADVLHLKTAAVQGLEVEQTGSFITAHFTIISTQDSAYAPVERSSWQFDFERTSQGWRARDLKLMSIGNISTDEIGTALIHAPR